MIQNISGRVSRLLQKTVNNAVKAGDKVEGANKLHLTVPEKAISYDFVDGIGKRGKFQLYSFKDEHGKTIQHYTRYVDDNGKVTDVVTDFDRANGILSYERKTINAGQLKDNENFIENNTLEETKFRSLLPMIHPTNKGIMFQKTSFDITPEGDFGGVELLQKGKKAVGISYKYNWNGEPAEINYKNTLGKKLDITDDEKRYLPFVSRKYVIAEQDGQPVVLTQDFTTDKVKEKVGLAQIIQEKLHDIEGIMPRAQIVKKEDLLSVKTSGKTVEQFEKDCGFLPLAENCGDGQINIRTDYNLGTDGLTILDLLSHEIQHAADYIKMYRGGEEASNEALKRVGITLEEWNELHKAEFKGMDITDYLKRIIEKKGPALKGTDEYKEAVDIYTMNYSLTPIAKLKSGQEHDAMALEQRAINREHQQMEVFSNVCAKISSFFQNFFA